MSDPAIAMPDMSAIRAYYEQQQRAFLDKWAETHDFDFCPFHGFWKLGPKKGGLHILTCPGCNAAIAATREMVPDPFAEAREFLAAGVDSA